MSAATIKARAQQLYDAFESDTRNDGTRFYSLRDGSPEWMTEVCHAAHGDMMPDDWRYETIMEIAQQIAESDDPDDVLSEQEPDVYTHDLLTWVSSHLGRMGYCDEAAEDVGGFKTLSDMLMAGQVREREEIAGQLLTALADVEDEDEDEEG